MSRKVLKSELDMVVVPDVSPRVCEKGASAREPERRDGQLGSLSIVKGAGANKRERQVDTSKFRFVSLDYSVLDEVVAIEKKSYPAPWSKELMKRTLDQRVSYAVGLFIGECLVGYAFSYVVVDELHILNIAVDPDYRGYGLGNELLRHVLSAAVDKGVNYAILEVRVTNLAAQKLYSSLGFRVAGIRRRYYRDNGEDALVLDRDLLPDDGEKFKSEKFKTAANS